MPRFFVSAGVDATFAAILYIDDATICILRRLFLLSFSDRRRFH